jgi:hypothetical protein
MPGANDAVIEMSARGRAATLGRFAGKMANNRISTGDRQIGPFMPDDAVMPRALS